jgi:hypothetical protein
MTTNTSNGNLSAAYFRNILDEETKKLTELCQEWESLLSAGQLILHLFRGNIPLTNCLFLMVMSTIGLLIHGQ